MLVVTCAACGGLLHTDDAPVEPAADASSLEASSDSTVACPVGDDAAAADASFEASPPPEASTNDASDASDAADAREAADAGDASDATSDSSAFDAAPVHSPCLDACGLGDQECGRLPQVCTYDDAGFTVGCASQGLGVWTCVVGATGCTVWANGVTCLSDVPCCVTCEQGICPLGSVGDPCEQNTDCASNACDAVIHVCVSSQCADHRQDGLESDVDCGGYCDGCRGGQGCQSSGDCQPSEVCIRHVCSGTGGWPFDASARDAAEEPSPCADECTVGDQGCSLLPQVCTYDVLASRLRARRGGRAPGSASSGARAVRSGYLGPNAGRASRAAPRASRSRATRALARSAGAVPPVPTGGHVSRTRTASLAHATP
jgi:hypothetical protein